MPTKQYVVRDFPVTTLTVTTTKIFSFTGTNFASILYVEVDSGTGQTLDVKVENLDPLSFQVLGSPLITHTQVTSVTGLPFSEMKVFADTTTVIFTPVVKVTFTLGGTTPSFSCSYNLISKGF